MRVQRFTPLLLSMMLGVSILLPDMTQAQAFKQRIIDAHRDSIPTPPAEMIGAEFMRWQESNDVLARRPELHGRGLRIGQILAYDRLATEIPRLEVKWDESHAPIFISGAPLQRSRSTAAGTGIHGSTVHAFLTAFADVLDLRADAESFVLTAEHRDEQGRTHLRYQQRRDGIPVHGKDVRFGIMPNGDLDLFLGRYTPDSHPTVGTFTLDATVAIDAAHAHVAPRSVGRQSTTHSEFLVNHGSDRATRCWYDDGARLRAAYFVELHPNILERWHVTVDASDGTVLRAFNAVCADGPEKSSAIDLHGQQRTLDTYLHQGNYYLIDASRPMFNATASIFPDETYGTITTLSANNSDIVNVTHVASANNQWSDASAVSAHSNAAVVYDYFRATHGRNSLDGKGGTIISMVNVTSGGRSMENAFWNGQIMAYGNGGANFEPLAKALDVAAHEMTHGVTEHSAGLEYLNQSGALNEAFSDIFAVMVDREDWLLGEDVTITSSNFPTGALRSMEDPHNGAIQGIPAWQPKHMNEYQHLSESEDNGGVHVNSGIINHSAYLLAQAIGREKAERILYDALTTKLTRQARFIDYRLAIIRAAQELYGASEAGACATACDQVGIIDGNPTGKPGDLPPVDGIDRMLFTNTDPSFPAPLWIAVPPATHDNDFSSISFTPVWSRPSISDNGTVAVFVSDEFNIHAISLVGDPNEQMLDNSGIWNSIALSGDTRLLAVTTISFTPELYLIDISGPTPRAKSFPVSTPNYTGDEIPNTARFVDAVEFSLDDRTLLFDTYNEIDISGYTYGFWDINRMEVWDRVADQFGTGRIERIFPQDPAMNLGNPTFAKNKPSVIAFDAQFQLDGTAFVMALDIHDGDPVMVAEIPYNTLGYPNYSGNDATLSFVVSDPAIDVVFNQSMAADGVTPIGSPQGFIPAAIWPLWFRTGIRPLAVESAVPETGILLSRNYPNPFNPATTLRYHLPASSDVLLTVHDAIGRRVATLAQGQRQAGDHTASWDGRGEDGARMASGVYTARLVADGKTFTRHMLLLK
ncbi:MAG: M4 family metallopeptidase [Bacteroidota bacterium]|nr:M4 family metallopeptidase [Bacteroidota bacterium]